MRISGRGVGDGGGVRCSGRRGSRSDTLGMIVEVASHI